MEIKRINGRYLKAEYTLGRQQFKDEFWFTRKFLKETLKRNCISLGAFEKNRLIGVIQVDLLDRPKAWIFFFDVNKEHRKKGLGTKLLNEIIKKIPKGFYKLYVDLEKTDKEALKFYKAHGFTLAGKIEDWFGKSSTGLLYSKTIDK
ncbi:MAG: GNAT family N-acetyltransferase [Nanoarchaeota archaeon]|nr:GNAT family N-acetyltransferase [Nanoarchaeota archaeon]